MHRVIFVIYPIPHRNHYSNNNNKKCFIKLYNLHLVGTTCFVGCYLFSSRATFFRFSRAIWKLVLDILYIHTIHNTYCTKAHIHKILTPLYTFTRGAQWRHLNSSRLIVFSVCYSYCIHKRNNKRKRLPFRVDTNGILERKVNRTILKIKKKKFFFHSVQVIQQKLR